MTPAEQLAAARENVVGPYLPARKEWLREWVGPVRFDGQDCILLYATDDDTPTASVATPEGELWLTCLESIEIDVHRPEVRDHLVRCGCPEWARDVPAGVWCWGMTGVAPTRLRCQWREVYRHYADPAVPISADATVWCRSEQAPNNGGHRLFADDAEGRACADVAALNAGCILRVEGGWLVPMPDGGIGFFPEVSRDE